MKIFVAALLCGLPALAQQQPTGEIRLAVTDPSGAAMEASGRLSNRGAGLDRRFHTGAGGVYTASGLPYGIYTLEIVRAGFLSQRVAVDVHSPVAVEKTVAMALARGPGSKLEVVATLPLPGVDLSIDQMPVPVQTATAADIEASGARDLPDFLNRRLNGVYLNEMQGNPFQPDVNFRGYTASPLLGTPQGISVYLDGVRQNQPFGDVVSWDLIPNNAIASTTLISGSDPLFGLNTLGGALSLQSKDGYNNAGLSGRLTYGSSGRKALEAEYGGGKATGFNWFLAATAFHESGWRAASPSDVRQGFARLGWRTAATDLWFTSSFAYNTLTGNGLQDYRLLARDYGSVYTVPDTTANRSPAFNFGTRHSFGGKLTFSGNVSFRNIRTEGINGNANTDSFGESVYQLSAADIRALTVAGYSGFPTAGANAANTPFPKWRCIAQALQLSEPSEKCDGLIVYSKNVQNEYGLSGQATWLTAPSLGANQLTAGAAFDRGSVRYTQNTQFGYIQPDYRIAGVSAWQDGSTNANGEPVDSRVDLRGTTPNWSLYATDTLSIGRAWNLTFSGRYNRNTIDNRDRIDPGGGPGSLDGHVVFSRFNPSVGATWNVKPGWNLYGSFTQGSRSPTSIELGCADAANPCNLPNALASDPPLRQVRTGTWEVGARGKPEVGLSWNVGAFRSENHDDILFVAAAQTGSGYFRNFARTRRQGIQAGVDYGAGRFTGGLDYTLLDATYQSTETLNGAANNTSDLALEGFPGLGGNITIHPGNRIPLTPKHNGKAFLDVRATSKFFVDFTLLAVSSSYARGNENNAYAADGKYYLGPGVSPGYAVANFRAHYDWNRHWQAIVQVDNLFDRHYYTAAQIGDTAFTAQGTFVARPFPAYTSGSQAGNYPLRSATFFAPGAPRRVWVELRLKF